MTVWSVKCLFTSKPKEKKNYVLTHRTFYHVTDMFYDQNFNEYTYLYSSNDKFLSFEKLWTGDIRRFNVPPKMNNGIFLLELSYASICEKRLKNKYPTINFHHFDERCKTWPHSPQNSF